MRQAIAKLAAGLDIDHLANRFVERFYTNAPDASRRFARRFQVLAYHKVSLDPHPFFEPTLPSVFEQHMMLVKRYYRVMSLTDLVDRSQRGDVPERAVAITFDDGYLDNYEFAFPILKKYQLPATIFVATGAIETGEILWHDRVFDAFRYSTVKRASLPDLDLGELNLETDAAKRSSLDRTLRKAKASYGVAQRKFVEAVERELRPDFPAKHQALRMLTWDQIREMHKEGIEMGSHTVNHPVLARIPREVLINELRDSKRELSEQLGATVTSFAYPNGKESDYNEEVKTVLRECGYTCAVTSERGVNRAYADPFELRRGQPWHDQIDCFRLLFFLERHNLAY